MLNFYKTEADDYPEDIDMDSSPTTVYIHKNVEEVTRIDKDGNERTAYQYDEAALSRENYAIYAAEAAQATADYIAMMLDVDI